MPMLRAQLSTEQATQFKLRRRYTPLALRPKNPSSSEAKFVADRFVEVLPNSVELLSVRKPASESANPQNASKFSQFFNESGYISFRFFNFRHGELAVHRIGIEFYSIGGFD
jgi:hypothetical protein